MLSSEIIKKIRKIHIKSGRMVNTLMAGQYRSIFRGSGIEFEEVREYTPGDDVKSIDWKVSARLGRPFIKRYCEERETYRDPVGGYEHFRLFWHRRCPEKGNCR